MRVTVTQTFLRHLLICVIAPAAIAAAQDKPSTPPVTAAHDGPPATAAAPPDNPLTANSKFMYGAMQSILLRSAEKMPEENYAFKPTEGVRTFGQIVGHVADAQYIFCSIVLGEKSPTPGIAKTKTSKADLIAALKEAFAYCDRAYVGMTDAAAAQPVKFHGQDMPKLGVLTANSIHTVEHYGNLITYMRMKNIVPPTSDPEFQIQKK